MKRLAVVVVASCGKGDAPEAAPRPAEPAPFADATGVVVTAKGVFVDGKSLGVLPARLLDDPAPLVALLHRGVATPLAYTDDAPAAVVLAAVRGIDNAIGSTAPPPVVTDEAGGTGTAMRLEEPRFGKRRLPPFAITAMVTGKPAEVCRAAVPPGFGADDEQVELVVQVGHGTWQRTLSRINEVATSEHGADLGRDLRDQKASAFFSDRDDIVLTAAPDATGADLTPVLAAACATGFVAVQWLSPDAVRAMLSTPAPAPSAPRRLPSTSMLSLGVPAAQGDLDKAVIRRYISRNQQKLLECYDGRLAVNPGIAGTVQTSFLITAAGTVGAHHATGVDAALASCVDGVIAAIEFPKPRGGGAVQVTYPLAFRPVAL